ncbi:2'-5' RNA ligase family protein [Microbacterium stercoris]|uniref:2'-5' RNA ligase family protein n=1 Tax=Microbacterium stercoris TaxID=2820289 RepID=A0A939QPU4_9MICO|nr:2'-5' RNA ligase family protein [Microbacterium stercoris]MBO3662456.1 2'-5' RNA ligase family protein [Microbacterium stercoris]MBO3664448.1 2'-5' RNA ligase family protein [Microbacterium stercoris]
MNAALICPVLAAEAVVERHRDQLDTSSEIGVPPHVTVIVPFALPDALDESLRAELAAVIASVSAFFVEFTDIGWFGEEVAWLRAADDSGFRALTSAVHHAFPDFPPYAGEYEDAVPHLTIGTAPPGTPATLRAATANIRSALPIRAVISEVHYGTYEDHAGSWRVLERLPLGSVAGERTAER